MPNDDLVGKNSPPFTMTVEHGKVRELASATFSTNPEYLDGPHPPIPPTFLVVASFWQPPEETELYRSIGIDERRLLHGAQEYVFFGPPPKAGDDLTAQTHIESIVEKSGQRAGKMRVVELVTEFRREDGTLAAQARATAIETEKPVDAA